MSIRVDLSGSKIAITSAYFVGFQKFLNGRAARELGFMLICAIWLYTVLSHKLAVCPISKVHRIN